MSRVHFKQATTYPAIVGRILETKRKEQNLDQAQMAKTVGVTQSTWSRMENGTIGVNIEQLVKAALALTSSPSEVLREADTVARELPKRGIQVEMERIEKPIDQNLLLIGAAALSLLVIAILASKR